MAPGVYAGLPSVLLTASETCGERASLSVPEPVAPESKSVAVAVLARGSAVIAVENATGAVNTSEFPGPAAICAPVAPKLVCPASPVTVPQPALPIATQVTLAVSVTPGCSVSLTATLVASDNPPWVTVTV